MGKRLIIPGADFSANAIPGTDYLAITFAYSGTSVDILAATGGSDETLSLWKTITSSEANEEIRVGLQEYFIDNPTADGSSMLYANSTYNKYQQYTIGFVKLHTENLARLTSLQKFMSSYNRSPKLIYSRIEVEIEGSMVTSLNSAFRDLVGLGSNAYIKVSLDGSNLTNISSIITGASNFKVLDLSGITNFDAVTNCSYLCYQNSGVKEINLKHFKPTNIAGFDNYKYMFNSATGLEKVYVDDATAAAWLIERLTSTATGNAGFASAVYDSVNKVINITH